ncbi:MAG: hypothetical protein EZS28_017748 [Streblomastix strix]|uniref:B30.2/SPRY domain-containing protein n=1 Tax=Streblomastix strix TaxID=222440 RepID=A0A5J4VX45_9EUKA|nr:MAG: hypothetical protein EZS28_017748 [Streblomastix strix]
MVHSESQQVKTLCRRLINLAGAFASEYAVDKTWINVLSSEEKISTAGINLLIQLTGQKEKMCSALRDAEQKAYSEEQLRIKAERQKDEVEKLRFIVEDHNTHLLEEVEIYKSLQQQDIPYSTHSPSPVPIVEIESEMGCLLTEDGLARKVIKLNDVQTSLCHPVDCVMSEGIYRCEFRFDGKLPDYGRAVGVVKADYIIPYPCESNLEPHQDSFLGYWGGTGGLYHAGLTQYGNKQYKNGPHTIIAEFNSEKGTLHFFNDGEQQKFYATGINEPVKFYGCLWAKDSYFTVMSLKRLGAPQAVALPNDQVFQW